MSDIVANLQRLHERQKVVEKKLAEYSDEHERLQERILVLESALANLEQESGESDIKEAREDGIKQGEEKTMNFVKTVLLPIVIGFLSWFLPATLEAIKHSIVDETLHPSGKQTGPPEVLPPNGANQK